MLDFMTSVKVMLGNNSQLPGKAPAGKLTSQGRMDKGDKYERSNDGGLTITDRHA